MLLEMAHGEAPHAHCSLEETAVQVINHCAPTLQQPADGRVFSEVRAVLCGAHCIATVHPRATAHAPQPYFAHKYMNLTCYPVPPQDFVDICHLCLVKDASLRPSVEVLLEHPFIKVLPTSRPGADHGTHVYT